MKSLYSFLNILFLVFVCQSVFGQEVKQVTYHEQFDFEENYVNYYEYDGAGFFMYHTLDDKVVAKQISNGVLKTIYTSPFTLCETGYLEWYAFENKIVFIGLEGLYLEDMFTGDFVEENFSIGTDYQLRSFYDFQFDQGRVTVVISEDSSFVYDMILEQNVPAIDGAILFRTDDYLYYNNGSSFDRNFIRKEHASTIQDTLESSFRRWRVKDIGTNYLTHLMDGRLTRIDKETDQVFDLGIHSGNMIAALQFEEHVFSIVTSSGVDALLTIFENDQVLSQIPLSTGPNSTLNADFDGDHLLMIKNNGFEATAYVFDLVEDTLYNISGNIDVVDFFDTKDYTVLFTNYFGTQQYYLVNKKEKTKKPITINNSSSLFNSPVIVKDDQGVDYIQSYDEKNGIVAYLVDPITDSLSTIQNKFQDNYGLGTRVQVSGEILYAIDEDQDSIHLLVIDQSVSKGVLKYSIENQGFSILVHEGKFAYFTENKALRTETSRYYEIYVLNTVTGDFIKEVESIEVDRGDFNFAYHAYGRHMLITIQDDNFAFDLNDNSYYSASDEARLLFELAKRELEDYYIVDITIVGGPGRLVLQSKADLSDFIDISTKSPKYLPVKENEFVYYTFTETYFHDGEKQILLGTAAEGVNIHEIQVSENKKYVLFNSTVDQDRAVNVFDIETQMTKQYILPRLSWVEMDGDNLLIYGFYGDTYDLEIVDVETDISNKLDFDYKPELLSTFNEEFHFYDRPNELIQVYDESLQLLESIPNNDAKDLLFIPLDVRRDVDPMISFAYVNRNLVSNSIVRTDALLSVYSAVERKFDFYFDCDDEASLIDVVKTGKEVFSLAGTASTGYQIYVLDVDDYSVNTTTPQSISFNVFPNPVGEVLHLSTPILGYTIFDALGNIVGQSLKESIQINVENLQSGVYFLKENRANKSVRFVKIGS